MPWFFCLFAGLHKIYDNKYELDLFSIIITSVSIAIGMGGGGFMIWAISIPAGIAVIGFMLFLYYFLAVYILYKRNNDSLNKYLKYATIIIVILVCVAVLIYGIVASDLDGFIGFSIAWGILNLIMFCGAFYYNVKAYK